MELYAIFSTLNFAFEKWERIRAHQPINLDEEFINSPESDNAHDKYAIKFLGVKVLLVMF